MPRRNPELIIWRVLHRVPERKLAISIYWGRGTKAKQKAERTFATVTRTNGTIGLYRGIFPVKLRQANKLPKIME